MFAGGFDLVGACAVANAGDDLAVLDLLDALVRKSLLVADKSSGRTRFSMLETIRQFAEEQLVNGAEADQARDAHAYHFAMYESHVVALWDSPRQREAYEWLARELPNLRVAFRRAADSGDLDTATAIAFYPTLLGLCSEQYEPVAWAEELIEPAKAVNHRRLAQLYVAAAQCYAIGRVDESIGYAVACQEVITRGCFDAIPFDFEAALPGAYHIKGQPEKSVAMLRDIIARSPGTHILSRACLVLALANTGAYDEAIEAAEGLPAAADNTDNPNAKALALAAYGWA